MEQNNNNNTNSDYDDIINNLLNNFSNQVNNLSNNIANTTRSNNLTQTDTLFESVLNSRTNGNTDIRATVNETTPLRATRNPNHPLSFTFSGTSPTTPTTPPTHRQETIPQLPEMFSHNERYTLLLNVIQTTRIVIQNYSNQMRDYQTNVANTLQNLNLMYQDIYRDIYRDNQTNPLQRERTTNNQFRTPFASNENRNNESNIIRRRRPPTTWNDVLTNHFQNLGVNLGNEIFSLRPNNNNQDDLWLANLLLRMGQTQENVIVAPTSQQIEDATEDILFNEENYDLINETRCPITLEDFQENQTLVRIRRCGHVFSQEPFRNWFRQSVRCPVCRHDIRDNIPVRESIPTTTNNTPSSTTGYNDPPSSPVAMQRMNSSDSMRSNISDVSDNQTSAEFNYIMLFPSNNTFRNNQNDPSNNV